ncbi:uncharacterized protein LOC119507408 [Choloepus didactylus]|uniref:uncharacterized protein LOC119507408 n=1 Tax=Choloepus didactylus TaxID=27675 RepID=UPI00189C5BAF|nr:uncharacterized protein LOC119507408 [Choloepus didactylus]
MGVAPAPSIVAEVAQAAPQGRGAWETRRGWFWGPLLLLPCVERPEATSPPGRGVTLSRPLCPPHGGARPGPVTRLSSGPCGVGAREPTGNGDGRFPSQRFCPQELPPAKGLPCGATLASHVQDTALCRQSPLQPSPAWPEITPHSSTWEMFCGSVHRKWAVPLKEWAPCFPLKEPRLPHARTNDHPARYPPYGCVLLSVTPKAPPGCSPDGPRSSRLS